MKKNTLSLLLALLSLGLFAQEKVHFPEKFKKKNRGSYKIEINEVKELIHIMIALTASGLENDDMVQQQGQYYKDVMAHFKPYGNDPIIKSFDSLMTASLYHYIFLTGNGISYDFKGDKLVQNNVFEFPATGVADLTITENPVATYKKQIEDFARKSKFRNFYKNHKAYYDGIIADYEQNANLGRQWKWLEAHFDTKIDSYILFCSPLINGLNYTGEFNNNNFRLIYMNLPPLDKDPKLTPIQNELFNTRVMFTEIDHNYVNPPSDRNSEMINTLFKERGKWVNEGSYGTSAYPNPIKVFNEYMTYGVFILYCMDHYDQSIVKETTREVIQLMTDRGFPKMEEFTDKLLKTSSENRGKKIDQWYPEFLKQFEN